MPRKRSTAWFSPPSVSPETFTVASPSTFSEIIPAESAFWTFTSIGIVFSEMRETVSMSGRRKPRPPRITRNPRFRPEKITASFGAQTTTWALMKMMIAMIAVAPRTMAIPMVPGVM